MIPDQIHDKSDPIKSRQSLSSILLHVVTSDWEAESTAVSLLREARSLKNENVKKYNKPHKGTKQRKNGENPEKLSLTEGNAV